jgi:DNA-binding beta-propeller fold protein YncE
MGRMLLVLSFLLVCAGCQGPLSQVKQPLQSEGELILYIQPFPQEAQRLDLTLASVAAVKEDGTSAPLEMRLSRLNPSTAGRQRFLASGELLPGVYRGLSFRIASATIKTEDGTAALLPPEQETVVDFPFTIKAGQASMATLALNYRQAVQEGFRIVPAFTPYTPPRPLPTLTGYVSNRGSHNITLFDKKSGEAGGIIATGREPSGMVLDQVRRRLYVALSGDDAIEVIDTVTDSSMGRIRLTMGDAPRNLAISPDGNTLLAINSGSSTISFVDPFSLTETGRLDVDNGPESAVIDASGRRAYVFSRLADTMTIIDMGSRVATTSTSTEAGPLRGQFSRLGERLMVIQALSQNLLVLDSSTLRTLYRIPVGMGASVLKVDPMTDLIYVGMKHDSVVPVFAPFTSLSSDSIRLGAPPGYMTIDGELGNLLCLLPSKRTLSIINLVGKKQAAEIDLGDDPYWLVVHGER